MKRSANHIYPLLCLIAVLAGVLAVFILDPAILQRLTRPAPEDAQTPPPLQQPDGEQEPPKEDPPKENPPKEEPPKEDPPKEDPPKEDPPKEDPPKEEPPGSEPTSPERIVGTVGEYYTYNKMRADLAALNARYPNRLSYRTFGVSADGRALYAALLGDPAADKQVIVTAGMHAREYVNCYVVMRQIEYYLINYDTAVYEGHSLRELFDEICFVIVPMANPDGVTLAQEGLSALRREDLRQTVLDVCRSLGIEGQAAVDQYLNRYWKSNAAGVDINRNFDALWQQHDDGRGKPHSFNYKGEAPLCAPEAAALVSLTQSLTNPVASICMHSQGEIIYWRCFQQGQAERENERLASIAADVTGYGIIDENQTEPSYSNWTILSMGIPTITVETGLGGYPQSHTAMADGILDRTRDIWAAVAAAYAEP